MSYNNFRRASSALRARQAHYYRVVHLAPANELPAPVEVAITHEDSAPEEERHEEVAQPAGYLPVIKTPLAKCSVSDGESIFDYTQETVEPSYLEELMTQKWSISKLAYRAEGGFGRLYEATHLSEGRFAVKVQSASGRHSIHKWAAEVEREVLHLSSLNHAHIVKYLDHYWATTPFSPTANHLFIKTELLEVTLWDALEHLYCVPMDGFAVYRLAKQITSALAYLHQRCVVHHDIKPQNLMMANQGWRENTQDTLYSATWKLIDMGLCQRYDDQQTNESSFFRGTAVFKCPEKASSRPYNPYLADSYAWGVTLLCAQAGMKYTFDYMCTKKVAKFEHLNVQEMAEEYFRFPNRQLQPMEEMAKQMLAAEDERLSIRDLHQRLQSME